jgi:hypothetical protein
MDGQFYIAAALVLRAENEPHDSRLYAVYTLMVSCTKVESEGKGLN